MGHMSGNHVWIGGKKVWVDIYIKVCMLMNARDYNDYNS